MNLRQKSVVLAVAALCMSGCELFRDVDRVVEPDVAETNNVAVADVGTDDVGTDDVGTDDVGTDDVGTTHDIGVDTGSSACPEADVDQDPGNCGSCGVLCFGECEAGRCDTYVIAAEQNLPFGIDFDTTHLFWSNQEPGSVWRAPLELLYGTALYAGVGLRF